MVARKTSGDGVDFRELFTQFQAAMLQRMQALEKTVGELAQAVNDGRATLPREFMRREDCVAFHKGMDERFGIWMNFVERRLKAVEDGKMDRGTMSTSLSTAKIAFGIFVWLVATLLSIAGTTMAIMAFASK